MATIDSLLEGAGVESSKRQKVQETVEDLLSRMSVSAANAAVAKNDEKWEARLSELNASYESKCDEKIAQSEDRTKSLIDGLAQKLDNLEKSVAASPGTDPWHAYQPSGQQLPNQPSTFVPSKVEIKGWVKDWAKRSEQALTHDAAMKYLHDILSKLPAPLQTCIDVDATKRMNSGRIMLSKIEVKVKGGRDACKEIKQAFEGLFTTPENFVKETRPRCTVEPAPAMKPVIQQGAKMLGMMERDHGIGHLKPEWGQKLSIYQVKPSAMPILLAEFSVASGWIFNDTNLGKAKQGLTGNVLTSAMAA